jgi:hypothetical protein
MRAWPPTAIHRRLALPSSARKLRFARCCYDHLAGLPGVAVATDRSSATVACASGRRSARRSELDQNAKSAIGVVGTIQIMPATGKDLKVGDITQLEPNIHAGVK